MHTPNSRQFDVDRPFAIACTIFVMACSLILLGVPRREGEESSRPSATVPVDRDHSAICDAILRHALTDAILADSREFYGTPGIRRFALVTNPNYGIPWPEDYAPEIRGWEVFRVVEGEDPRWEEPPLLGFRLDKFELPQPDDSPAGETPFDDLDPHAQLARFQAELERRYADGPIVITMMNVGGLRDGRAMIIGGARISYAAHRKSTDWTVECLRVTD